VIAGAGQPTANGKLNRGCPGPSGLRIL
jgi:hypothetical protein